MILWILVWPLITLVQNTPKPRLITAFCCQPRPQQSQQPYFSTQVYSLMKRGCEQRKWRLDKPRSSSFDLYLLELPLLPLQLKSCKLNFESVHNGGERLISNVNNLFSHGHVKARKFKSRRTSRLEKPLQTLQTTYNLRLGRFSSSDR